ncbi:unnamed protein product [Eruca vesicaria subsp. sativa]|uniref:Uncharacterized protein n=1 Tax=Eruca vesicaria subsp. sativa TaxID=29727 RepID=A0ABC8K681_ERUVS|nr:unnamed protein product [Eruca vesicaria subsp. sativa]
MSNRSPVFPIHDSQHYSDYGFNYFQVMEEARKHKRETSMKSSIINSLHFKIQKPKDDPTRSTMHHNNKRKKRWWWKKALPLFKWRKWPISTVNEDRKVRNFRGVTGSMSMSSPVYSIESRTGSNTPYRTTTSRPIAGTLTPARKGDVSIPYLSLRELNIEQQQRISISSSPIYLVT